MAVTPTSSGSIVDVGATSGTATDANVAIPSDAELIVYWWSRFSAAGHARSGNITLDGTALTIGAELAQSGDACACGVAYRVITSGERGTTKAFHRNFTANATQGGIGLIQFFKGNDTSSPVRDADIVAWEDPGPVVASSHNLTVDSATTDRVVGMVSSYFGTGGDGVAPDGAPASQGQTVDDNNRSGPIANDYQSDLLHEDTPGSTTTNIQVSAYYGTLAVLSIKQASSGVTSTVAATQSGLTGSASASEAIPGTAAGAQPGLTASASGSSGNTVTSTGAGVQPGLAGAATSTETIPGTAAAAQSGLTAAVVGMESQIPGAGLDASAALLETIPGTAAGAQPGLTVAASATETDPATVAAAQSGLTGAASGSVANPVSATAAGVQAGLTAAVDASQGGVNSAAGVLPSLDAAAAVTETEPATVAASQSGLAAAAAVVETDQATVAATQAGLTGGASASETVTGAAAGVQPGLVDAASVTEVATAVNATVAATLPGLVVQAYEILPSGSGGRRRGRYRPAIGA